MAAGDAHWKAGVINVPGSTGSQAITGLGGTPKAVIFFGTNFTTEDSAITTAGTGLFRSWAAPRWNSPSTIEMFHCWASPAGNNHNVSNAICIGILDGAGTTNVHAATLTSFDADGFTLNWLFASSGYKVVYVALMDVLNVGAYGGGGSTNDLGFKAGAGLLGGVGIAASINSYTTSYSAVWHGSAAYPGTSGWQSAAVTQYSFPTSTNQQYIVDLLNQPPGTVISQIGDFPGPFLSPQNLTAVPTGVGLEDLALSIPAAGSFAAYVMWDDDDSATGRVSNTPDNATDTTTITGLPFQPGLVLGYASSDEPQGGLGSSDPNGVRGAIGLSVATRDFQWSAMVDGVDARGSFQSFQYGFADYVDGTLEHAGTVELTNDGFIMETVLDSAPPAEWVWHAFGHPEPVFAWIPQIYRRQT